MTNLSTIRKQISKVSAEIRDVKNAVEPFDVTEQKIRAFLKNVTAYKGAVVDNLAQSFVTGNPSAYILDMPQSALIKAALGIGLAAIGIDQLVAEARQKAEADDSGCLKLPAHDKAERLAELRRELYELEAAEEQALYGEARRENVTYAAAILGIPVDVAEAADLLK